MEAEDDWQTAAFSTRHMHNRIHQRHASKRSRPFDVYNTFGTYVCECPAWSHSQDHFSGQKQGQEATMELYRLASNGEGVVGEIVIPGLMRVAVVLGASRKSLTRTMQRIDSQDGNENRDDEEEDGEGQRDRYQVFGKNSFRAPKFWMVWNGVVGDGDRARREEGSGYVVFSGNEARKFKGTISCDLLGWKNVAMNGRKMKGRKTVDVPVSWGEDEVLL